MFKVKTRYYLELLTPEAMDLLGSTKITKNKSSENVLHLKITEVIIYTFVPNKQSGQLLDISPNIFIFLQTFNSDVSYIEVCFTSQNSKLLDI